MFIKPRLIQVMASSLDGQIACHGSESVQDRKHWGFIDEWDHRWAEERLCKADTVLVGASSLRAQGFWPKINHHGQWPWWVVFTTSGKDLGEDFWGHPGIKRILVCPEPIVLPPHHLATQWVYGTHHPADFVWQRLQGRAYNLLFGGGQINALFYQGGWIDELHLTLCPFILAQPAGCRLVQTGLAMPVTGFRLRSCRQEHSYLFLEYERI